MILRNVGEGLIFRAWVLYFIIIVMKLILSSFVLLMSINTVCKYCYTRVILHKVGVTLCINFWSVVSSLLKETQLCFFLKKNLIMLESVLFANLTVICAITNFTKGRISFFKTLRHSILIAALFSLVNTLTLPLAPSGYQTVRTLDKKRVYLFNWM